MTRVYEDTGGTIKRAIDLTDSSATVEGNSIAADATSGHRHRRRQRQRRSSTLRCCAETRSPGSTRDALNVRGDPGTADTVTVSDSLFTTIQAPASPVSGQ